MSVGNDELSSGAVLTQTLIGHSGALRVLIVHIGPLLVLQDFCVGLPYNFSVVPFLPLKELNTRFF